MSGAIPKIEQEINALEQANIKLANEFHQTYTSYLNALGQAVRQQLIWVAYHLCTQGYPDAFLRLSFERRQTLQQSLKQSADRAQEQLRQLSDSFESVWQEPSQRSSSETTSEDTLDWSNLQISEEEREDMETMLPKGAIEIGEDFDPVVPLELRSSETEETDDEADEADEETEEIDDAEDEAQTLPERLAGWQEFVESSIAQILQTLSRSANQLLQQYAILPKQLPPPLLEAAAKADAASADGVAGPPNILNLLVETEQDGESDESEVTQLVAVNLQLSEIEFSDATVNAWRTNIRELTGRLNAIAQEYHHKLRQRAVAEAESAWRSTWFDE
jgi:hypothetical protein